MSKLINYINIYEKLKNMPSDFSKKRTTKLFNIFSKLYEWRMYEVSDYYRKD